jgi:RHS repeat-associated protein
MKLAVTPSLLCRFISIIALLAFSLSLAGACLAASPVIKEKDERLAWNFAYDDDGRVVKAIDPAGRETAFQYIFDDGKRLRKVVRTSTDGAVVTQEFDESGLLSRMIDSEGDITYGYDGWKRLNRIERQETPAIAYTYDTQDRVASLQIGDFYRIEYGYDFLGRLETMKTPAGLVCYEYLTGQGQVVRTLPNGLKTFWKRQPSGELEEITHGFLNASNSKASTVLAQYAYTHGPDGRITAVRERFGQAEFVRRYTYDTMGRLVSAAGTAGQTYSYTYDLVGNRIKATSTGRPDQINTYDWAGRLTSIDGKPARYDVSGNLVEVTMGGVTRQYRYHPDGRLAEAQAGSETVRYRYDGFGRLIARKTDAGETRFVPDQLSSFWQPLIIEEPGGARTLVVWDGAVPLALVRDGKVEWQLHDHLGSVRVVTDSKGGVVRRVDYEPFGVPATAERPATMAPGFAGLFWDGSAAGYLTLARNFVAELGRFAQPDPKKRVPVANVDSVSFYAYSGGDPANWVDRDGASPVRAMSDWFKNQKTWWTVYMESFFTAEGSRVYWNNEPFRDEVVLDMVKKLFAKSNGDIEMAWNKAKQLRKGERSLADFDITSTQPTGLEYQAIDDFYFNLKNEALAKLPLKSFRTWYGKIDQAQEKIGNFFINLAFKDIWLFFVHPIGEVAFGFQRVSKRSYEWMEYGKQLGREWTPLKPHFSIAPRIEGPIIPFSNILQSFQHGFQILNRPLRQIDNMLMGQAYASEITENTRLNYDSFRHPTPEQIAEYKTKGQYKALEPSSVGGVYLGGSAGTITGLGMLKGVNTDANGSLLLVGEDGRDVRLPPLRLDDVVTVFRSVYLNGEGPTVTIDPNPENPEKYAMIIRHSEATEGTYVGWILYQADRLMKGYTLGVDNKTQQNVVSHVPGYNDVLDRIYFGGDDPLKSQQEGVWERFWIVPAEVRRFEGLRHELTLFDVPLKVKTQKMKWVNSKLVDDRNGVSSPGAKAFTSWFTKNYDGVSTEQYLLPPPESGFTEPVPIFTELRRIALITAIAEKLRDQGVPLPFWMREYEVRKVPFEEFTPSMIIPRKRMNGYVIQTARIFGGVQLSADSKVVKTYATAADATKAPPEVRAEVNRSITLAERLERAVADTAPPSDMAAPLTVYKIVDDNREHPVVSVPGALTQALAPCQLEEVDLVIPVQGGGDIRLERRYNSFFQPKGLWGRGWTMDLPRLEEGRTPLGQDAEGRMAFMNAYEVLSPLNRVYAKFNHMEAVPELKGSRHLVPEKSGAFLALAETRSDFFSAPTRVLIGKDGGMLHFSKAGDFVAREHNSFRTIYERDENRRIIRIVGLQGRQLAATIRLEYDAAGRLRQATGQPESTAGTSMKNIQKTVTYEYDAAGALAAVRTQEGRTGYRYDGPRLTTVTFQGPSQDGKESPEVTLRRFEYGPRGQLVAQIDSAGMRTDFRVDADTMGQSITVTPQGKSSKSDTIRYDRALRPVEARYADGSQASWTYPEPGGFVLDMTGTDGRKSSLTESPDRRSRTLQLNGNLKLNAKYDAAGRLTSLTDNEHTLRRQKWSPDGMLLTTGDDTSTASFLYDQDGLLSHVVLTPPGERKKSRHWQETKLDPAGRPRVITDNQGLQVFMDYDAMGAVTAVINKQNGKNYGYHIVRDANGRIGEIQSNGEKQSFAYGVDGLLTRLEVQKGGKKNVAEWKSGILHKVQQFDGGEFTFTHHEEGKLAGLPKTVTAPNQLMLSYNYDESQRLTRIHVGSAYILELGYDNKGRLNRWSYAALEK